MKHIIHTLTPMNLLTVILKYFFFLRLRIKGNESTTDKNRAELKKKSLKPIQSLPKVVKKVPAPPKKRGKFNLNKVPLFTPKPPTVPQPRRQFKRPIRIKQFTQAASTTSKLPRIKSGMKTSSVISIVQNNTTSKLPVLVPGWKQITSAKRHVISIVQNNTTSKLPVLVPGSKQITSAKRHVISIVQNNTSSKLPVLVPGSKQITSAKRHVISIVLNNTTSKLPVLVPGWKQITSAKRHPILNELTSNRTQSKIPRLIGTNSLKLPQTPNSALVPQNTTPSLPVLLPGWKRKPYSKRHPTLNGLVPNQTQSKIPHLIRNSSNQLLTNGAVRPQPPNRLPPISQCRPTPSIAFQRPDININHNESSSNSLIPVSVRSMVHGQRGGHKRVLSEGH